MDTNQPKQSKAGCLKIILLVAFFPFTLSYLILKQKQLPLIGRLAGVALLWIVFIAMGASGSNKTESATTQNAAAEKAVTPTPAITMEQKQADFKEVYIKYYSQAQAMILIQAGIQQIASVATSKADLYLALDKLEKMRSGIASANMDIKTPSSLKEYKQINEALMDLSIGGNNFTDAIKRMKEYVNKDDLEKLTQAKEQLDRGTARLTESKDLMDAVAKTLEVDVSKLQETK